MIVYRFVAATSDCHNNEPDDSLKREYDGIL